MSRLVGSTALAALLVFSNVTSSFSATSEGALEPGKPAGVKKADLDDHTLLWALGLGVVIGGIFLVTSGGSKNSGTINNPPVTTTTTSSTSSSP